MRVLGVQCTNGFAFLTVQQGGAIVPTGPGRLSAAQSVDQDQALWETLDTFGTALDEIEPDRVHLLLPGTGPNAKQTHGGWRPRIELETLLRMAAAKRNIPVTCLARATVLSRLGLSRAGKFEDLLRPVIEEVGPYWGVGRLAAAAAALAVEGKA